MASPKYVYPWWGRNMVDDPEKHIDSTGQYKKPDPWEKRTTQKQEKGKEIRGTKHSLPNYTYPCTNMQSSSDNSTAV
jgi:hypothetical protein